jgi:anti-sigma factor RsiW
MAERSVFTDEQIQDYIDGRLNQRDRAAVAAYLLAHPRVAAEVEAVRRQSEALSALGQEILDAPVPEHLRQLLRERPASPRAGLRSEPRPASPRPIARLPNLL